MALFCFVVVLRQPTLFQLFLGSDAMYEVRRRKHELTLLPTQGIFNLPHNIGMV